MPRSSPPLELPVRVSPSDRRPLYRQIAEQLIDLIRRGVLDDGARLPTTRAFARALGINRNVVVAAFDELRADGYIVGRQRSGTFVHFTKSGRSDRAARAGENRRWAWQPADANEGDGRVAAVADMRLGAASVAALSVDAWRRAWRLAAKSKPPDGYGDPQGDGDLRAAIAAFLARRRGIDVDAGNILITSGAGSAVALIARTVLRAGLTAAVEDPGYPRAYEEFAALASRVVAVPVDRDGICVDELPASGDAPVLVHVTPSHHFPLGGRLPAARREALLSWAAEHDALIIENDYDSEFRFEGPPLPALAGSELRGHVAYVGTFSKILSPSLRFGYIAADTGLVRILTRQIANRREHTSWPVQRAVNALLRVGDLERHIRRMRREYARRRAQLIAQLASHATLFGLEAGLHCCIALPATLRADEAVQDLARAGVLVESLTGYHFAAKPVNGLLVNYGAGTEAQLRAGVTALQHYLCQRAALPEA